MVFDVESIGLHGEGFAWGAVIVDSDGNTLQEAEAYCDPGLARGTSSSHEWVRKNVTFSDSARRMYSVSAVRQAFWSLWAKWKKLGATLAADCCWPVEARFLAACVDDLHASREWEGPYPLLEISTVLLCAGQGPLAVYGRLPSEVPAHSALSDARQSARLLLEALSRTSAWHDGG